MNRFLLGAGLALCCLSCGRNAYTVDGAYTAENGSEVYLIDLQNKDTLGVTTVQDNAFTFTGKVEEPVYVYVGRSKERVRFILEPGTVQVDLDGRTESGTPLVDMYNAFHRRFYAFDAARNGERKELQSRRENMSVTEFTEAWDALNRKYTTLQADLTDSLVRACPDPLLDALAMGDLAGKDTARFMALYREAPEKVKSFYEVADAYGNIERVNRTAPGRMFTDYMVSGGNPDGTDVKLSDYVGKGKYILLDHWASWCGPCKAEMPYLKKTYEAFHGDRFDIVGVAVSDKRADTEKALEALALPWNQILDAQRIPVEVYGVAAIPHLILFAPDGTIVQRGLRGEQTYAVVQSLLSE